MQHQTSNYHGCLALASPALPAATTAVPLDALTISQLEPFVTQGDVLHTTALPLLSCSSHASRPRLTTTPSCVLHVTALCSNNISSQPKPQSNSIIDQPPISERVNQESPLSTPPKASAVPTALCLYLQSNSITANQKHC
jgi:hypothetical protein